MKQEIKPDVVCFIVPPSGAEYDELRNSVCTVVRRFRDGECFGGMYLFCDPPDLVAWVVRSSRPVTTRSRGGIKLYEFPIYEGWLRPISGPDIDISEQDADPVHELIQEAARA